MNQNVIRRGVAVALGLGAALIVYWAIVVLTRPHSVYFFPPGWFYFASFAAGLTVGASFLRLRAKAGLGDVLCAVSLLAAAIGIDRALNHVSLANAVFENLWVK